MKAKRKIATTLRPLAAAIARDAKNKAALETEFLKFYAQIKETMRVKPDLHHLDVPLERVKKSIQIAAHGMFFGTPMVIVREPKALKK